MPAPGDQHSASLANPFEEPQKRMAEYTAQQIATLQSRLEKQLGPEYLSSRSGPSGQKVHYIAAEKCIALANEVFGFNGWSSSIQNIQVDFVDEHPQTFKISLGLSVIVRVTLRDGTFHEDIGYGHIENCKGKAAAFEKAKKEGTTDALKRALRNFGNVLGNCIYDKDYLAKVTKIKAAPTKFDESRLYRHADYAKQEDKAREDKAKEDRAKEVREKEEAVKKEMADAMGLEDLLDADFDEADFAMADEGHPDEVSLPNTEASGPNRMGNAAPPRMQPPARPMGRSASAGSLGSTNGPQTPHQAGPRAGFQAQGPNRPVPPNQPRAPMNPGAPQLSRPGNATPPPNVGGSGAEPVGFFSARAVPQDPTAAIPPVPAGAQAFNPKLESPSIRKTPGIDHNSSKPVSRTGQHVPPASSQSQQGPGGSSFTPVRPGAGAGGMANQAHQALGRRIGAPGGPASPLANRNSYRPPTMTKRPAPQEGGAGRPPLAEVTNSTGATAAAAGTGAAADAAKRQKMS